MEIRRRILSAPGAGGRSSRRASQRQTPCKVRRGPCVSSSACRRAEPAGAARLCGWCGRSGSGIFERLRGRRGRAGPSAAGGQGGAAALPSDPPQPHRLPGDLRPLRGARHGPAAHRRRHQPLLLAHGLALPHRRAPSSSRGRFQGDDLYSTLLKTYVASAAGRGTTSRSSSRGPAAARAACCRPSWGSSRWWLTWRPARTSRPRTWSRPPSATSAWWSAPR